MVNKHCNISMEYHNFQCENSLCLCPFSMANCWSLPIETPCPSRPCQHWWGRVGIHDDREPQALAFCKRWDVIWSWLPVVTGFLLMAENLRQCLWKCKEHWSRRDRMMLLPIAAFGTSIFPIFYNHWMLFMYVNDHWYLADIWLDLFNFWHRPFKSFKVWVKIGYPSNLMAYGPNRLWLYFNQNWWPIPEIDRNTLKESNMACWNMDHRNRRFSIWDFHLFRGFSSHVWWHQKVDLWPRLRWGLTVSFFCEVPQQIWAIVIG